MMKSFLFILLLFSTLFGDEFEHHSHKHIQKELSHISLSHKQKEELKKILKAFRSQLKEYRIVKKELQRKKEQLFLQKDLKLDTLNALDAQRYKKAKEIENEFLLKIHTILSPKQRKSFIEHFDDWEVE